MKLLILSVAAGALSGFGGAMIVRALPAPSEAATVEAVGPGAEDDDVVRLLAELRAQNDELLRRIEALEVRPVDVARSAVEPVDAGDDELLAEMRALLGAMKTDRGELPTNFHASVANVIEDIRAAEDAERDRERAERTADRIADRVSELTVELGLSTQQASQLHDQMVVYDEKRDELRDQMREGGDWGAARQGFRDLRDERDTELQKIFTADQFTRYEELDDDDPFRRGRGRGGDDNRDSGGGGRRGSRGS